jgi:hypothetical protein
MSDNSARRGRELRSPLRGTMVVAENTADALTTANRTAVLRGYNAVNQLVVESLMVAFAVVMNYELVERTAEVPLAQRNDAIKDIPLCLTGQPLCVRIAVRCPEQCLDSAYQPFQAPLQPRRSTCGHDHK